MQDKKDHWRRFSHRDRLQREKQGVQQAGRQAVRLRQFDHSNVFAGKVLLTSFVGGQWRTLIALEGVRPTQILALPQFQPQVEQRLWLELPPERCQIVLE